MSARQEHLDRARRRALEARTRLTSTLVEMQSRLRPAALFENAIEDVARKANRGLHDAIDFTRERPATVAAGIVATLVYLFRDTLFRAIVAVFSDDGATTSEDDGFHDETETVDPSVAKENDYERSAHG